MIRVVTYNIKRGLGPKGKREMVDEITLLLESYRADIVSLQEVWRSDLSKPDHIERLSQGKWPHFVFAEAFSSEAGSQGNAILSKLKIADVHHVELSIPRREPRKAVFALIEVNKENRLWVSSLHLGLRKRERITQIELLADQLEINDEDGLLLCGDFNDWQAELGNVIESRFDVIDSHVALNGKIARTFPASVPILPLDRIYHRGLNCKSIGIVKNKEFSGLSDHLPLCGEYHFEAPRKD